MTYISFKLYIATLVTIKYLADNSNLDFKDIDKDIDKVVQLNFNKVDLEYKKIDFLIVQINKIDIYNSIIIYITNY